MDSAPSCVVKLKWEEVLKVSNDGIMDSLLVMTSGCLPVQVTAVEKS